MADKELDRKRAGLLCHDKVFEVNVARLCCKMFTFVATKMASQ